MQTDEESSKVLTYKSSILNESSEEMLISSEKQMKDTSRSSSKKSLEFKYGLQLSKRSVDIQTDREILNITPPKLKKHEQTVEFKTIAADQISINPQSKEEKKEDYVFIEKVYPDLQQLTFSFPQNIPNFKDLFEFNLKSISLNILEKLNCFSKFEAKRIYKNFFILAQKTLDEVGKVMNFESLKNIINFEDFKALSDKSSKFEEQKYSFLTIYHLFHLMKYFPRSLNSLNRSQILKNALESTKKSVELISIIRRKVEFTTKSILVTNFHAFIVYFMDLSFEGTKKLDLHDIRENYIELVYNETLK